MFCDLYGTIISSEMNFIPDLSKKTLLDYYFRTIKDNQYRISTTLKKEERENQSMLLQVNNIN